jgi:hypothetical protein
VHFDFRNLGTPIPYPSRSYGGTQGYANKFSVLPEVKEKLRSTVVPIHGCIAP